ncbi:MAG TPA: hypothetical protein PK530_21120, partial [Anaerolineales bacterium]|nr:hypothetical protein [Anaerolineales bacterium]
MNTFRTALKALSHPLSLFAIVILLVNDHILKVVMPSSLTGKLSDFAGLFFFPFLLAGLLGWVGERVGLSSRPIARIAFGLTALWFAGIKTIPALNAFTAEVAEVFLGHPTFYMLDPTDLISLVVLPFAWNLWRRMEEERRSVSLKPAQIFAFGLAVVGMMASSPCVGVPEIQRVIAFENNLYVQYKPDYQDAYVLSSSDDAKSWQYVEEQIPPSILTTFQEAKPFPILECVATNPQICYRITGNKFIETSQDKGQTWQIAWRAPVWRTDYYTRLVGIRWCSEFPDFVPNDLIIVPNANNSYRVVAALGNQGLLTFVPTQGWEQIAVDEIEPLLPFVPLNQLDGLPFMTANELVVWAIMGFFIAVKINSTIILQLTNERAGQVTDSRNKISRNNFKFFLIPCLLLVFWQIAIMTPISLFEGLPYLLIVLVNGLYGGDLISWLPGNVAILITILLILVFFLYLEKRRRKSLPESFPHFSFTIYCACSSLLLFLAGWLPFAFWAFGWIPLYWPAFILSFGLAIVVYIKALQ